MSKFRIGQKIKYTSKYEEANQSFGTLIVVECKEYFNIFDFTDAELKRIVFFQPEKAPHQDTCYWAFEENLEPLHTYKLKRKCCV